MKPIVIYGAGGAGKVVKQFILDINSQQPQWDILGYVVTDLADLGPRDSVEEVLGDEEWLSRQPAGLSVALGIGTPGIGKIISERLRTNIPGLQYPNIVDPNVIMSFGVKMGIGNLIGPWFIVGPETTMGDFNFLNCSSVIGHDVRMGSYCVINPGGSIGGGVEMGDSVLVAPNASIMQYKKIGSEATITAGAVVNRDVPDGASVVGIRVRMKL
jgi:sugar O-acyltransferase (sialic acid O-acetyltransferase NeuD family)